MSQLFVSILLTTFSPLIVAQFDHSGWDGLLNRHVKELRGGKATQVDYQGMLGESGTLDAYLENLSAVPRTAFDNWSLNEQLAFLINAYNAWTVHLILTRYPDIQSIRDIGFLPGAAWRRNIVSLFGEQVSLDDVEHNMIRGWGRYNEARIHFAVNCAAIGCPALRSEAYVGARLEDQLESSTVRFLSDRERNHVEGDIVWVSPIFDWYEEDFERGWNGISSVSEFLLKYRGALGLDDRQAALLAQRRLRIRYLDYDWGLNAVRH